MTAEWDDTTNIRVPTPQHTEADDIRPDGATWGDCLLAGAKALAGEDVTDDTEATVPDRVEDSLTAIENRTGRLERLIEEMQGR